MPLVRAIARLGFVQAKDVTPIVDTDVFDEAKYVEESGSDSSAAKAKRAAQRTAQSTVGRPGTSGPTSTPLDHQLTAGNHLA